VLKSLEILGLRGFATRQQLALSPYTGESGSGLTVIVGANNAGKSTVIEALRAVSQENPPSITQGRRNLAAGDEVSIRVQDSDGRSTCLRTARPGSSETEFVRDEGGATLSNLLVLPSRRVFNPYFNRSESTRQEYMLRLGFPAIRTSTVDAFAYRLFTLEKNRASFDEVLSRVVSPVPDWTIDLNDSGQYFLKLRKGAATHTSEGMGEGLISLLFIVDALYDSAPGDCIVIDEPELSLHPALQRKLAALLLDYSRTRQIVLATHSPYFVPLDALPNGATVARVYVENGGSIIAQLSRQTAKRIFGLLRNENNPHIFGLLAQEIFFVDDGIILVEGQEDVVFFNKVQTELGRLSGTFFGWGVGGADNMERVACLLSELHFQRVVGILDGNRVELSARLQLQFPAYHFFSIPADDVRTKLAIAARPAVAGLLDDTNMRVRPELVDEARALFERANEYLRRGSAAEGPNRQ